ncbi:uncharacterized protein BX663DRAFT_516005 [Cokeromyces recurvatus]|uniref:uncharacterized protein n=1 Tax=Cokeromyces recurvatus TaxID=90255 RepID=UPI00221F79A7|nr:uncharacterized protein BX663DRAFT_516005 [Cokeromyces recurvatus]KAI7901013.1 hypothetical protein BX663DRAFT_516005 [Cokeromyces recurvatus]
MSFLFVKQAIKKGRASNSLHPYELSKFSRRLILSSRYSSAATAVATERPQHIILPNPGVSAFKKSTQVLPSSISEQFAILKACIMSQEMTRAERVMIELYRTRPDEMKLFADINIYNSFLNGFVEAKNRPMTKQCLTWFDNMKMYGITADHNTYAIILKGFLRARGYHTARAILAEMTNKEGISVEDMLKSKFLEKKDIVLFREMIDASRDTADIDVVKLLRNLENATDEILGKNKESIMKEASETSDHIQHVIENVPEVRSTKSVGVHFLQEQLAALRDPNAVTKMDPFELQLGLEQQGYEMALQQLLHTKEQSIERGDTLNAMNLTPLKRIMWDWHQKMVPLIKEEIERCDASTIRETERQSYGPFLKLLPPDTLSMVTILELLRLHNSSGIGDGMKTARAVINVGKAVEMEYNAVQIKKRSSNHSENTHALFASGKLFNLAVRKVQSKLEQEKVTDIGHDGKTLMSGDWNPIWPNTTRAKLGSVLTSLLLESAKIPVPSRNPETGEKIIEHIPAFFHTYQYVHGKRLGIIKFSDQLTQMLSREPVRDTLHPRLLPMLVHPRPWLSYNSGGYLSTKSNCMRIKDSTEQLMYLQRASEKDHLTRVLAGLDVLGSTRWRVNKDVFKVVLEVWNSGEALAGIPPAITGSTPLPPKPENYDTDPKAKFNWVTQVKKIQTTDRNNHSLRCDVNYKVETARAFLNLPMYFPHNMDFRGRAYPMPPTLNHLGNDLCRGLLTFDKAKPLGPNGWRWLKIHLANLYGYDKHAFSERETFTMDNINDILDSVDKPLTGNRWWLKADSPWQCLAACYEVAAAYRSGKPEEFKSQLPVHQDGTCNGLQHYAALGGDLAGARAVNLSAGDRPADVYTSVADMVNVQIDKAAAEGNEMAMILQGNISRKVVKQTVMTNVYGVTFIGARNQIENRLRENPKIPKEKTYILSAYLAKAVFSSLGEMFTGARKIQDWLTDSAKRIARSVPLETLQEAGAVPFDNPEDEQKLSSELIANKPNKRATKKGKSAFSARNPQSNQMSSVIWTTPLGLPIVQPYRRSGKRQVATLLQTIYIEDPDASRPVNATKQSTAFPPNFIHSLDATHMLMSAVACHRKGLTFASVHDSYWTHACDVDAMNEVIRDQFIELHSQPIMENLLNEFKERYQNYRVPHSSVLTEEQAEELDDDDDDDDMIGHALFGDPTKLENGLKREKKKDTLKAIFGLASEDEDLEDEEDDGEKKPVVKKKKKNVGQRHKHTWEPLTFAPLPPKGEFDINEVKKSPYFFH